MKLLDPYHGDKDIRLLPYKILTWWLFRIGKRWEGKAFWEAGNTQETLQALCHEIRRRLPHQEALSGHIFGKTRALLQHLCPTPCQCGRPGLYIVGCSTYCARCKWKGEQKLQRLNVEHDKRAIQWAKDIDARRAEILRGEQHYKARGRRA